MEIRVDHNFRALLARMQGRQAVVQKATRLAVERTALDVRKNIVAEMSRVFDRPVPYTLKSLYVRMQRGDVAIARVWLKDEGDAGKGTPATKYLAPQIFGGERKLKRFERSLQAAGLLPAGMNAVPGAAAKLDAHGNMLRSQIVQILSYLRAFGESGYRANMTTASAKRFVKRTGTHYFVGRPGGRSLPLGVWETRRFAHGTSSARPVLIFTKQAVYKKRLQFFEIAHRTVEREFEAKFHSAYAQLIRP